MEKVFFKIPSEYGHLGLIRQIMADLGAKIGFPEETIAEIKMAVDEACTNIIKHAYSHKLSQDRARTYSSRRKEDIENPIELQVEANDNKLVITIIDHGKEFDFDAYLPPTLEEYISMTNPTGLGVRVIRTFMDEINYTWKSGVGNVLKLTKHLPN